MVTSATKHIVRVLFVVLLAFTTVGVVAVEAFGQVKTVEKQSAGTNSASKNGTKPKKLTAADLKATVQEKLSRNPYYMPGFLLSRGDVDDVCEAIEDKGFDMPEDREALYEDFLSDTSPLVKLLKTPSGRTFMKKIAGDPTVYDRLERLSWSFDGRMVLERMVSAKDGPAKIKQLQTKEQVAKLSKALASDPRTQDFALPTGRVHTADELCEHLMQWLEGQNAE